MNCKMINGWTLVDNGDDGRGPTQLVGAVTSEAEMKKLVARGYVSASKAIFIELPDGRVHILGQEVDLDGRKTNQRDNLINSAKSKLTKEELAALGLT